MSIRSLIGDSAVDLVNLSLLLGASFLAKRKKHMYPLGLFVDVTTNLRLLPSSFF